MTENKKTMPQDTTQSRELPTLTEQDRADFEKASNALREQLGRTEASPAQQVRMRLALWIFRTGLETNQADFDLLDRLCRQEETEPHDGEAARERS